MRRSPERHLQGAPEPDKRILMKVYVNDKALVIFRGCRAKDAVLRFLSRTGGALTIEGLVFRDAWGNRIEEDSPMTEGRRIFFQKEGS